MSNNDNSNRSTDPTVQYDPLMGGGVRVSLFRENAGDTAEHTERMVAASERVQLRHGGANSHIAVTTAADGNGIAANGQIVAARSQQGMPRSGARITDQDLVDLGGVQVRIREAIAVGAVVRNADGSFSLAGSTGSGK